MASNPCLLDIEALSMYDVVGKIMLWMDFSVTILLYYLILFNQRSPIWAKYFHFFSISSCKLSSVVLSIFCYYAIEDKVLEEWRNEGSVSNLLWNHLRALLLKKHKHQHVSSKYLKRHTSKAKLSESKLKLSPVREISESVSAPNLQGYNNGEWNRVTMKLRSNRVTTTVGKMRAPQRLEITGLQQW